MWKMDVHLVGVRSWAGLYEGFWAHDVMAGLSEIIGDVGRGARIQGLGEQKWTGNIMEIAID